MTRDWKSLWRLQKRECRALAVSNDERTGRDKRHMTRATRASGASEMGMNGGTTYDRGDWVGMIEAFTHAQIREQKRIADALEVLAGARKAEEDMNEFIAGLGLEPSFVSSVTIRPWVDGWWVEAEVVAHDENGRVVYGEDADEPRVDTIEFGVSA